jgi:four helix bundle protein
MRCVVKDKSFEFALRIVDVARDLRGGRVDIMARQLLRSGTSIGAAVREAEYAESRPDFIHKMSIALKEANEVAYWLELLHRTHSMDETRFEELNKAATDLLKLLTAIVRTSKRRSPGKLLRSIRPAAR